MSEGDVSGLQNTSLTKQLSFTLPLIQHLEAPPPDLHRQAKRGHPIKGRKPPFDGAHEDGKNLAAADGSSLSQLTDLCEEQISEATYGEGGDRRGRPFESAIQREPQPKRETLFQRRPVGGGGGGGCKSAFERLIRTEEPQTCSGRRPVSTSNGGAAQNRQTGPG